MVHFEISVLFRCPNLPKFSPRLRPLAGRPISNTENIISLLPIVESTKYEAYQTALYSTKQT